MKELRPAIIRMHERGISKHEIARLLDILRTTVREMLNDTKKLGATKTKKEEVKKRQ